MMPSHVTLGEHTKIRTGKLDANASSPDGEFPFFTCASEPLKIASFSYDCECVLVAGNGNLNVKYYSGKFDAYQRTYIIESINPERLNTRYLYHFMESHLSTLREQSIGGIIKYIKISNLTDAKIPLPPLPEQRRIAAILDKAEALHAKRREAITKLDQLLQYVFLEMFGDPVTNPKGWPRVRFSELLESIDSGTSPVCLDRSAIDNEWAVLKLSAITRCEYDPSANKALPEGIEPDKSLEVKIGDLLFTRKNTRDLVAACAFVTDTPPRLLLPDLIFRFRLKKLAPVVPRYLQALLAFPGKRKDIQSLAGGSAGSMPNISKAKLSNALIELPPTDLQCEFERRLKHCDLLREKQRLALVKLDATFFALQQQAFAGKL